MKLKFKTWEKCIELIAFLVIILSIIYKALFGNAEIGELIFSAFLSLMFFCIFYVAAFFPATWRMTQKQKSKIKDIKKYQEKYIRGFVFFNFIMSVIWSMFILFLL